MTKKWIDISQPLRNDHAEWPGDTPFSYEVAVTKEETGSVNIGKLTTSTHMGTHIDAPFHFLNDGATVEQLPLETYIGHARVIELKDVTKVGRKVLEKIDFGGATRILLKTEKREDFTVFPSTFTTIEADLAPLLKERGVKLLGIDAPSVDGETSKTLDAHHALHENGVMILENIVLGNVPPGDYELIALPLHIVGADGSPVRAVIRPK